MNNDSAAKGMAMNIREFAALCGVSPASASRILNYPLKESRASPATFERVRQKAAELGFRPHYAAKILHSRKSNCLGVIIGYPNPVNALIIIKGIADCAYRHGLSVSIASCGNSPRLECAAFEDMLYRKVDAIIWHPVVRRTAQPPQALTRMLRKVTRQLPVVSLNDNTLPYVFKFCLNKEEDAVKAALRQLERGCRKFAIIRSAFSYPANLVSREVYAATLREHGVAPQHIVEIVVDDKKRPPDWSQLRDVDGVWMFYAFMLHAMLPQMRAHCDLKRLHIDGQSFVEDYALTRWTYHDGLAGDTFEDLFGSLHYHLVDGTQVARRATEIALQAMGDPDLEPFAEPVLWQTPPHHIAPREVLFPV